MNFCMKINCNTNLESPGVIKVKVPIYSDGVFRDFYLCRTCFLTSDLMRADEFRKWVHSE